MRRLLLDTHAFLWWLSDSRRLKRDARTAISERSALVHVSAATIWEIASKTRLGKVNPGTKHLDQEIAANQFTELAISARLGEPTSDPTRVEIHLLRIAACGAAIRSVRGKVHRRLGRPVI